MVNLQDGDFIVSVRDQESYRLWRIRQVPAGEFVGDEEFPGIINFVQKLNIEADEDKEKALKEMGEE